MCNLAKTSKLKLIQNLFIYYYFKTFSLIYNEVSVATKRLHRFSCPSYSTLLNNNNGIYIALIHRCSKHFTT